MEQRPPLRPRHRRQPHTRSFLCTVCGARIEDRSSLRIFRNDNLPPECDSVEFVHADCTRAFRDQHPGSWSIYSSGAPEAAWFLPVMAYWR